MSDEALRAEIEAAATGAAENFEIGPFDPDRAAANVAAWIGVPAENVTAELRDGVVTFDITVPVSVGP